MNFNLVHKRILLKLSGDIIRKHDFSINFENLNKLTEEIKELIKFNVQIGIVIGGGNFFRGKTLQKFGTDAITSDNIGMISTVINGLLVYDFLKKNHINSYIMSSITLKNICDDYNRMKAIKLIESNCVVIFVAGIGIPIFTTDSAACIRGIEINAEIIIKATNVDGVFSSDPKDCKQAILYNKLDYCTVLERELRVMDLTAFTLAKEKKIPICIFNIKKYGSLKKIISGQYEGTIIYK